MTRTERNERIREWRYVDGLTCVEVAGRVGLVPSAIWKIAPGRARNGSTRLSDAVTVERNEKIRELRYEDGLTCQEVASRVGVSRETVGLVAPGRPGKIVNEALQAAFIRSGKSASAVARDLGWWSGRAPDASRVRKTLGITFDVHGGPRAGKKSRRRLVDAETAGRIAESIGVEPWEVGCNDA